MSKMISVSGKPLKFQIWDTAGQEKYHSLAREHEFVENYRAKAEVIILKLCSDVLPWSCGSHNSVRYHKSEYFQNIEELGGGASKQRPERHCDRHRGEQVRSRRSEGDKYSLC